MILTKKTTTIAKFKKDPLQIVSEAKGEPFAVIANNKAAFYVLSPKHFDHLLELIWEYENAAEILKRSAERNNFVRIDLDDL